MFPFSRSALIFLFGNWTRLRGRRPMTFAMRAYPLSAVIAPGPRLPVPPVPCQRLRRTSPSPGHRTKKRARGGGVLRAVWAHVLRVRQRNSRTVHHIRQSLSLILRFGNQFLPPANGSRWKQAGTRQFYCPPRREWASSEAPGYLSRLAVNRDLHWPAHLR